MKSILMKPHLVAQTFEGNKTHTRRILNEKLLRILEYACEIGELGSGFFHDCPTENDLEYVKIFAKYSVGETIYVKEKLLKYLDSGIAYSDGQVAFPNDGRWCWKRDVLSPLFMPRGLARLFIKITNVRVERLQDITEEDCLREGIKEVSKDGVIKKYCVYDRGDHSSTPWSDMPRTAKEAFQQLWDSINGKDESKNWDANPWVFVYEFERVEKP